MKPFLLNRYLRACCIAIVMAGFCTLAAAQENLSQPDSAKPNLTTSASPTTQWVTIVLPESDKPQELRNFIVDVSKRQASTRPQYIEVQTAIQSAAEKGLAGNPKPEPQLAQEFENWLVSSSVHLMADAGTEARRTTTQRLIQYLRSAQEPSSEDLQLAFLAGQSLEQLDDLEVAKKAYQDFKAVVESKKGEQYGVWVDMLKGCLSRLNSLGKVVELKAKTLSGESFELQSLKGKFVLLYFWATWDRVAPTDYPDLERTYAIYHELGLEVVSVSMDSDRNELESFVNSRKTPWIIIWEDNSDWQQSVVGHFGITAIPTSMLLDREGKVIHLEARGAALEKLLSENLGNHSSAPTPDAKPNE